MDPDFSTRRSIYNFAHASEPFFSHKVDLLLHEFPDVIGRSGLALCAMPKINRALRKCSPLLLTVRDRISAGLFKYQRRCCSTNNENCDSVTVFDRFNHLEIREVLVCIFLDKVTILGHVVS